MKTVLKLFVITLLLGAAAFGAGEKERMLDRVPQITQLKEAGILGETADGLLGFVRQSPEHKELVNAENRDRQAVYAAIAESQGVAASVVARRRALQIIEQAPAGRWFQNENGTWYQK